MPLPASGPKTVWPPKSLERILPRMAQWSAWYSGELEALQIAYGGGQSQDSTGFFASDQGGFKAGVGRLLQRWFVAQRPLGNERNTKLPIPIAAEMCQASADLLFADPITVTVGQPKKPGAATDADGDAGAPSKAPNPTQDRLNDLLDDSFHSTMAEAAELCAALGGVYLRVTWDDVNFPDGPFSTIKDADTAIPEFTWGRLSAVTFWSVIKKDGGKVWRHLERHETEKDAFGVPNGNGVILHGLYLGDDDTLGESLPLGMLPETAGMAEHTDLAGVEGTIDTGTPGLAVTYIPNQTPNRSWRRDAIGRHLGRSDLDGVEHLMDQLAETMSDWMRARRAARARVMMAKDLVKNAGPGSGTVVDLDQETYIDTDFAMGGGPSSSPTLADRVQVLQPTFDPTQYKVTADDLIEQILQMAGYSMQTFGVGDSGTVRTATEIESKERRSMMTRSRKIREWTPALLEHITKLLEVDNAFFGGKNIVTDLTVEFTDGVQETQLALAQTVAALFAAESASLVERVSILHPEWDEDQIAAEVKLIQTEFAAAPAPSMVPPDFGPVDNEPNDGPAAT
ncbi:MAG TPA: phage portal protein [Galbitalea sp.]|jgi:hypothetical protein